MIHRARIPIAFVTLAFISGCAGNGEGLDQNGRPIADNSNVALAANFDSIQANVFTPICSVCHSGATAPQGLRLDAANSYALLVGIASSEVPSLQRVQVGNPDGSYLLQKIVGNASVGDRMPDGGPYLPQATIDVIRQWIADGAQKSAIISPPGKESLRVVAAPLPEAVVASSLPQIVIGFNRELDANLINATTVMLQRTDTGEPIAIATTVPNAVGSTLIVTPRSALASGHYRLTLRGSGGGALAGLDAQPLNASAPAKSGSDYTTTFVVKVAQ
jgi:hypothetical protein